MRYPLWAFFFVLVMPIFTAHALLTGSAQLTPEHSAVIKSKQNTLAYWTYDAASR